MEKHPVFMYQKLNFAKMAVGLQIQHSLVKGPTVFFADIYTMILKFILKFKALKKGQKSLEKEEESWKIHTSQFQNLL